MASGILSSSSGTLSITVKAGSWLRYKNSMSALYPNLGDSQITPIWQPQPGPQTDLVTCPVFEVFYGGARGGGKRKPPSGTGFSIAANGERAAGLFVRRKLTQLFRCHQTLSAVWGQNRREVA